MSQETIGSDQGVGNTPGNGVGEAGENLRHGLASLVTPSGAQAALFRQTVTVGEQQYTLEDVVKYNLQQASEYRNIKNKMENIEASHLAIHGEMQNIGKIMQQLMQAAQQPVPHAGVQDMEVHVPDESLTVSPPPVGLADMLHICEDDLVDLWEELLATAWDTPVRDIPPSIDNQFPPNLQGLLGCHERNLVRVWRKALLLKYPPNREATGDSDLELEEGEHPGGQGASTSSGKAKGKRSYQGSAAQPNKRQEPYVRVGRQGMYLNDDQQYWLRQQKGSGDRTLCFKCGKAGHESKACRTADDAAEQNLRKILERMPAGFKAPYNRPGGGRGGAGAGRGGGHAGAGRDGGANVPSN